MEAKITRIATFTFEDGSTMSFPIDFLPYDQQEQIEAIVDGLSNMYKKRVTQIDLA